MSTHNICFRREISKILCGYHLISVAVLDGQGCKISSYEYRRLWSDCAHAHADLNLLWVHMSEVMFSHVAAHIIIGTKILFYLVRLKYYCPCSVKLQMIISI